MSVLRPMRLFSAYVVVTYGALSGTISDFACLIRLFQACSVCVTSGALSGTNASSTGLQNLMEATPGHEKPQSRGAKQSSYPPFNTY